MFDTTDAPETDATEPAAGEPSADSRRGLLAAHPLLVVAAGATLLAIGHGVWIWSHRRLGALDPDESGYIAAAFDYHRTFSLTHPGAFVHAVGATGFGPLVPLLGFPLLWVGPNDPRTVLLLQPILMVVTAIAVAGITRRVCGPMGAITAGLLFCAIPTTITATQSNWFGLGAATWMALGMWALLSSDRCRNRWTWAYGACLACMLLSRTMTLGFLPGALAASLVVASRERRSVVRLAQSFGIMAVLAGPWWIVERDAIFGYLTSYGYGSIAGRYGGGNVAQRLWYRLDRIGEAVGRNVAITALVAVAVAGIAAAAATRRAPAVTDRWRGAAALCVTGALGIAALVSTSNNGVWFELPIVVALIPLAVAAIANSPVPVAVIAAAPAVGMAIVQTAVSWWWLPPDTNGVPWLAQNHLHSAQFEPGFAEYDRRLGTAHRDQATVASRQWWALNTDVDQVAARITQADGNVSFWVSGNMELFNSNTLYLASQLRGDSTPFQVPDTTLSASLRRQYLDPLAPEHAGKRPERVLIVAHGDYIHFPPDQRVEAFARQATDEGWRVTERIPMPGHGVVVIMRHSAT